MAGYRSGKRSGASDGGGSTPAPTGNGVGFFNYQNTLPVQVLAPNTWTTFQNNALGNFTELGFAPAGVDSMLDPVTGRVLLDDLQPGDQIYVRHTLSIVPFVNGMTILFRNLVGQAGQTYSVPFGASTMLSSGAGISSGLFTADATFYVRDLNTKIGGFLPQIQADGAAEVTYVGMFISVTRRMV